MSYKTYTIETTIGEENIDILDRVTKPYVNPVDNYFQSGIYWYAIYEFVEETDFLAFKLKYPNEVDYLNHFDSPMD